MRLVEHGDVVMAFPGPHRAPVLPAGWAPLDRRQQAAVLHACDAAPDALTLRLGSIWEPGCEYRVYRLSREEWAGFSVVARHLPAEAAPGGVSGNHKLLGLARDHLQALQIAVDFFNWDLEAHGQTWRLDVQVTTSNHD
ncbi:MAG TPA: hypothetical protein VD833_00205 [Vicinamibacterales bacterium]|nr:hypothetical protein [Vicinamibacterales bacterium]